MQAYRTEKILIKDGMLQLDTLPFKTDDVVEIIILLKEHKSDSKHYPLRGSVLRYDDPFEPVAQEDWEVFK